MRWMLKLAWKNQWRNSSRTLITMATVFFAVILSVLASSLWRGVFDHLISNLAGSYTGYLQIHKKGYWNEQLLDNSFELTPSLKQVIGSDKNITSYTGRLESFALIASANFTKGCRVVGIDPINENQITQLKNKIIKGNYLKETDDRVMLGEGLAERFKFRLNDTVVMIAQGYHGSMAAARYKIGAIVRLGSPELNDNLLYMPLSQAQNFFGADHLITSCALSLKHSGELEETAALLSNQIGDSYEVMTWKDMMPEIVQHMKTDINNMKVIQGILYLLISFGILGTIIMMMAERNFEMAMLVAIGMSKLKMMVMLLIESVFTVITGCAAGLLVAVPLVYYLKIHPIRFSGDVAKVYERFGFEAVWPASFSFSIFISQFLVVLCIGLILSIYPLYRTLILNPVTAMRK